jgi:hypothetical protein
MSSYPTIFADKLGGDRGGAKCSSGGMLLDESSSEEFGEDRTRDREMFRGEAQASAFQIEEALRAEGIDLASNCDEACAGAV